MDNVVMIDCHADIMAIYKHTMLDKRLAASLQFLCTSPVLSQTGPLYQNEMYARWAFDALTEAKDAGMLDKIEPHYIAALACMGMSAWIVEGRPEDAKA